MAVDLGLRSGTALYGEDGRLRAYQSLAFRSRDDIKRRLPKVLGQISDLEWLMSQGEPSLAAMWERHAMRMNVRVSRVDGDTWRQALKLGPESRRSDAVSLARRILDWAEMPQPVVLPADVSRAICVGLWAVHRLGWLAELPVEHRALQRVAEASAPAKSGRVRVARVANG